jgi:hypothetical protein
MCCWTRLKSESLLSPLHYALFTIRSRRTHSPQSYTTLNQFNSQHISHSYNSTAITHSTVWIPGSPVWSKVFLSADAMLPEHVHYNTVTEHISLHRVRSVFCSFSSLNNLRSASEACLSCRTILLPLSIGGQSNMCSVGATNRICTKVRKPKNQGMRVNLSVPCLVCEDFKTEFCYMCRTNKSADHHYFCQSWT